jgi:hypothetical protein
LTNGVARPTSQPNAWVADFADEQPALRLEWDAPQTIARLELTFDTDFDHPMESVLMGHPERVMPFCVKEVRVSLAGGRGASREEDSAQPLATLCENHQTRRSIRFKDPVVTDHLEIRLVAPQPDIPAALFEVRCYAEP